MFESKKRARGNAAQEEIKIMQSPIEPVLCSIAFSSLISSSKTRGVFYKDQDRLSVGLNYARPFMPLVALSIMIFRYCNNIFSYHKI